VTVRCAFDVAPPEGVDEALLVRAAEAALSHGGQPGREVDLVVVSDEALAELHGRFLDDDSATDVMAFDLGDEEEGPSGEVYLSLDMARRVAAERGVSLARELSLYAVHGCLHLCGYDEHEDEDRRAMRAAERAVLDALGFAPDAAPHERD